MDTAAGLGVIAVIVLVLANGFFVATEFAIVAVRRSRIDQLAREGNFNAKSAQDILRHLDAYIAACQLGITIASLALGWIGEPALAGLVGGPLRRLFGESAHRAADILAIAIAFTLITALHIVLGELAPKGLALQRPEGTTLWVARPMHVFYALFRWPINGLNWVGNGVLRLLGIHAPPGHAMVHSAEELELLVRASQQAGAVEKSEALIATRAFQFADLTAHDLMTPRTELDAVPVTISRDELLDRAVSSKHSRLPVYEGSVDNILGVIRVRDLLPLARSPSQPFDLRTFLRPGLTVPESRKADDLLEDMRGAGGGLAVVVDEFGGTAGIVTLGDLMRALVGPINEEPPRPGEPGYRREEPDGSILIDGLMRLHELEELLGADLQTMNRGDVGTVGGLVMALLDRLPEVGDEVEVAGRRLRVERLDGRRVALVRLYPSGSLGSATSSGP